jgi:hypothetical protein
MKDLTLNIVVVLVIALVLGLAFRLLYPRVDLTAQLFGLLVFIAVVLKLAIGWLWSLRKPGKPMKAAE